MRTGNLHMGARTTLLLRSVRLLIIIFGLKNEIYMWIESRLNQEGSDKSSEDCLVLASCKIDHLFRKEKLKKVPAFCKHQ